MRGKTAKRLRRAAIREATHQNYRVQNPRTGQIRWTPGSPRAVYRERKRQWLETARPYRKS